jgi:hypothetical protein
MYSPRGMASTSPDPFPHQALPSSSELVGYVIEGAQSNPVCAPGFPEVSVP